MKVLKRIFDSEFKIRLAIVLAVMISILLIVTLGWA